MFSENNRRKLEVMLREFYTLTRIRTAVFDDNFNMVACYPEKNPELCSLIQQKCKKDAPCRFCDNNALEKAAKNKSFFIYKCHAGLTECVTPISSNPDSPIGYIMLGHMYSESGDTDEKEYILKKCRDYGIEDEAAKEALEKLSVLDTEYIISASHISQCLAAYILKENIYTIDPDDTALLIASYIRQNYENCLSVEELAKKFGIGKTALYKIFSKRYGMGIAEYVRKTRLEKAKKLLEENKLSVSEICEKCGFSDYNYFISCFKREFGKPPKTYAKLISDDRAE